MNQQDHNRVVELTGLLFDEIITDEQSAELNTLLERGAEQRHLYSLTLSVLQNLQADVFVPSGTDEASPRVTLQSEGPASRESGGHPVSGRHVRRLVSVVASIAALVLLVVATRQPSIEGHPTAVAMVSDAFGVVWDSNEDVRTDASDLKPGDNLRVTSGVLTVAFHHGVVTTIEGPAHVTVDNQDQVTLHQGRLATYVPEQAIGFRVETPTAQVVDLGTEFGVEVGESGAAEVHVFEGEVEVSAQGTGSAEVVLAGASRAVDTDGNVQAGEVNAQPFEATRDALHRRWLIRNGFNSGNGKKYASQFPGRRKPEDWAGPWQVSIEGAGAAQSAEVIVGSKDELQPGCGNRLSIQATAGSEVATLAIRRELELPADLPWNDPVFVDFLMRIEPQREGIEAIRLQGTSAAEDDGRPLTLWDVFSQQNAQGELVWMAGGVEEPAITLLPVLPDETCRYILKYTAGRNSWHVHVIHGDDVGKSFVKCDGRRRLPRLDGRITLNWEVDIPAGESVVMSLDSIRIHARPAPAPPDS